jgi:hypothetical protein
MLVLVLIILAFRFFQEQNRKIYEYMEAQREIQTMQEDIGNRPLEELAEFRRKRDEAVQRIRNGHAD